MKLIDGASVPYGWTPTFRNDEKSHLEYKFLLRGEDGDSPQNYEMALVHSAKQYASPQHRHNWDQLRLVLDGAFGDGKGIDVKAGQIGYYPEGVHYSIDTKTTLMVLLQFGGASGNGFIPYLKLNAAADELRKDGDFQGGIYRRRDAQSLPAGVKRNMDGYEAVWQKVSGKEIKYPRPRYGAPIVMDPANSEYIDVPEQPGVARKTMGVFTERLVEVTYVRVQQGHTLQETAPRATRLFYVLEGEGSGDLGRWTQGTAVELRQGESTSVKADKTIIICAITLPMFPQGQAS